MPKLKLKRTPAEERERALRKARRAAKKAARSSNNKTNDTYLFDLPHPNGDEYAVDDDDTYGPPPPNEPVDYAHILAELEERRFREKMYDAMADDGMEGFERLESVETRLNDFAHVPKRWRTGSMRNAETPEDYPGSRRPEDMEDEEYAEYVRQGMWRRTHKAEVEQAERERAAHEARLAHERELKAESERLGRLAEVEGRRRQNAKDQEKLDKARAKYESNWTDIISAHSSDASVVGPSLHFADIPWPVFLPRGNVKSQLDAITPESIEFFLFPPLPISKFEGDDKPGKSRRHRLREAMLRFHPDKFEGRVMPKVFESDREVVRDGVGRVVRAIGDLSKAGVPSA